MRVAIITAYFLLGILFVPFHCLAQAPNSISYQAIIRNENNNIVKNQRITIRVSILHEEISGEKVYGELHNITTLNNGLVTIKIGQGLGRDGDFNQIAWENGPFFIKTEFDLENDGTFQLSNTTELLSVPYALHSNSSKELVDGEQDPVFSESLAAHISPEDTAFWNLKTVDTTLDSADIAAFGFITNAGVGPDSTAIAEMGYVAGPHTVDTQIDSTGIAQYGYVAGPHTVDTQIDSAGIAAYGFITGAQATGLDSTDIANLGFIAERTFSIGMDEALGGYVIYTTPNKKHGLVVAMQDQAQDVNWYESGNYCNNPLRHDAAGKNYTDWCMPSLLELQLIYDFKSEIGINFGQYWSSTQRGSSQAYFIQMLTGNQDFSNGNAEKRVRAVRSF